jgi:hypothetical protein
MLPPAPSAITPAKDDIPISSGYRPTRPEFRVVDRLALPLVGDREVRIVFDALASDLQRLFRDADDETPTHP